ncbi:C40 family peptidase [Clostridium sp. MT-14]|uniref:C40 family peptidase n=1 Tax=Clostridium sp. MT-14 TaxID=3348360 RepID=UPI0035F31021
MKNLNEKIVEEAKKCLGISYMWGGESPDIGFDCSGLVQYVYQQVGISIPRTTYEQCKIGLTVGYDRITVNIKIGDLIFFKGGSNTITKPEHVGIYVGNGKYIQASHIDDVVKISDLNARNDIFIIKRIVNENNNIMIYTPMVSNIYLGDVKYVLYKYVVDLDSDNVTFRCGTYAYHKISQLSGFKRYIGHSSILDLNGEIIRVYSMPKDLDKRKLIISNRDLNSSPENEEICIDHTVYDNDIVLQFA